ncbi:MAG: hypothetical protein M5U26_22465 [Planctomycetota bacterium]|nr:hypothetical protein [Planctomycetota bacterium]
MKIRNRRKPTTTFQVAPMALDAPRLTTGWIEEPYLKFAGQHEHVDPKTGIPLYGPASLGSFRHKREVHVGIIGTSESVDLARRYYEQASYGVDGNDDHAPFPGCRADRGFRCDLVFDSKLVELITRSEHQDIMSTRSRRERFERLLLTLEIKLRFLTQKDHPLDYIVLALPTDLYGKCKTVDYVEKGVGPVHRDLRRAFKAMAMQYQKPTQILLDTTTGLTDSKRSLDHPSLVAWNLFTGLYFKIDGLPWGPVALPSGTCYIGISFFRPMGESSTLRTSVVQAFDENGEGLVLRGHKFHWDERQRGKSPHLSEDLSESLISMVMDRYKAEQRQLPRRVVVHKTSRYEPEERVGFEEALKSRGCLYDLVSLTPTSNARLLRAGRYPPLRGTHFSLGRTSYLYTTGFLPSLGKYPHGHVPSPLQVADHVGDTAKADLLREVLTLTKMNWNSANMEGLMPITLRFSRLVGNILRDVPSDREPQPKYKFYM